ncbi:MAG: hypothetical protein HQK71_04605 [Desulfamplus sp.]|nr:hypothetical protein [Desulfamplus sp.]
MIVILITILIVALDRKKEQLSAYFIIVFALILRLLFLLQAPTLSDDIYRYCLDGIMLINGENPYSYAPIELLGEWQSSDFVKNIYPEISSLLLLVNHLEFTTIYPPAAQIIFAIGSFIDSALNITDNFVGIKLVLLMMDTLSCILIIKILERLKLPACYSTIYAWHPLPVLEIAHSGHIDGAAIFFLLMAIFLASTSRNYKITKKSWWNCSIFTQIFAGLFMGLSILTKWLPLMFLPFLLLFMKYRKMRLVMSLGCIIAIVIFIAPFFPDIIKSFVTLNQYLQHWEFSGFFFRVVRNFMLHYTAQSGNVARAIIFVVFTLLYFIVFVRFFKNSALKNSDNNSRLSVVIDSLFKITLVWIILTPTFYPWYALYLVALLPFKLNANFNTAGITLSWSVLLSYKVLILYKLTGDWIEDTTISFMIMVAPLTALILQTYIRVHKSHFRLSVIDQH